MKNFIAWMFFCSVFVNLDLVASHRKNRVVPYGLAIVGVQVQGQTSTRRPSRPSTPVLVRNAYQVLQQTAREHSGRLDGITVLAGGNFDKHNVVQSQLEALQNTLAEEQRKRFVHEKSLEHLRLEQEDLRGKFDILQGLLASECRERRDEVARSDEERRLLAFEYGSLRDRVARAEYQNNCTNKKNSFLARKVVGQADTIEKLKDALSDLRGQVATLGESIKVVAREGDDVRNALAKLAREDARRRREIDKWSGGVVEIQNGLNDWADGVEERLPKIDSLAGRVDSLELLLKQTK
jgi:chromosome segregation ATPase